MKMFLSIKLAVLKECHEKMAQDDIMTDAINDVFEKHYEEIKRQSKQITKLVNKLNKKRTARGVEHEFQNHKISKRTPTEHQLRVSKCMSILKERYPDVKHQLRLGTSNYMATFIKNEFGHIDCDTETEKVERAITHSTYQMNEHKKQCIYPHVSEKSVGHNVVQKPNKAKSGGKKPSRKTNAEATDDKMNMNKMLDEIDHLEKANK